jgi:hypothetical protein
MKFSIFWIIPIIKSDDAQEDACLIDVHLSSPTKQETARQLNCYQTKKDMDNLVICKIKKRKQWTRLLRNIQRNAYDHDLRAKALQYSLDMKIFAQEIREPEKRELELEKLDAKVLLDLAKMQGIRQGIESLDSARVVHEPR